MDDDRNTRTKKWRRRAVVLGIALAVICHTVPPEYRQVCETLATFCRGGL